MQTHSSQTCCSDKCGKLAQVKDRSITKETLEDLMPYHTWVSLGELLSYSNNGIKKRAISLNCDIKLIRTKYKRV